MAGKKTAKKAFGGRTAKTAAADKRVYFSQADFPQSTLQQAQKIAAALFDNFAGKDGSPPDVALAIGISPTSSGWRTLTGSAIAYGLTDGGFNANTIKLTLLGRKLVAPEEEGADLVARREAIMKPRISKEFFERYRRAKFPNDTIASNVLKSLGIPHDRVPAALEAIKANGRYAGIIRETPTGPFVNLDSPGVPAPTATPELPEHDLDDEATSPPEGSEAPKSDVTPAARSHCRPDSTREATVCSSPMVSTSRSWPRSRNSSPLATSTRWSRLSESRRRSPSPKRFSRT